MISNILPTTWSLPQAIYKRVGKRVGKQRAMTAEGHLLLILHAPPKPDEPEREQRLFWRKPDGVWQSRDHGSGIRSILEHLELYQKQIDQLEDQFRQTKKSSEFFKILRAAYPLHRSARNMQRALQSARDASDNDQELINLRDIAVDIERGAELLVQDTKNALEYTIAVQAEEQAKTSEAINKAAHRLNKLAALFFPLVTLAGVFGMNLDSGFEGMGRAGFWLVILGGVLFGFILRSTFSERKPSASRPAGLS